MHTPRVGAGYVGMRRHAGVQAPPHNGAFLYGRVKGQGCLAERGSLSKVSPFSAVLFAEVNNGDADIQLNRPS